MILVVGLAVGAGAIALWIDARFPRLDPGEFGVPLLANVLAAALMSQFVAPKLMDAAGGSTFGRLVAIFAAAFPTTVYVFLVCLWILKLVQGAVAKGLR
jgi:hypothetical protein